jgi:hypothetical protein
MAAALLLERGCLPVCLHMADGLPQRPFWDLKNSIVETLLLYGNRPCADSLGARLGLSISWRAAVTMTHLWLADRGTEGHWIARYDHALREQAGGGKDIMSYLRGTSKQYRPALPTAQAPPDPGLLAVAAWPVVQAPRGCKWGLAGSWVVVQSCPRSITLQFQSPTRT